VARPSENLVVRRVRGALGHGGVVIGSEMSGGVRNVYVHDCEFTGTDRGLRIKSMRGRGAVVENVWYQNVRHKDLRLMVVEITTFYGSSTLVPKTQTPPVIRGVHVRDISAVGAKEAMEIVGLPEAPLGDLTFANMNVASSDGAKCVDVDGARFDNVKITPAQGRPFLVENARNVAIDHSCAGAGEACVKVAGRSDHVTIDGAPVR
jgi:polygalacturonase